MADEKAKATPAPWQMMPEECDKPYIRIRGTVVGGRHKIANVLTPIHDGVHPREVEETRTNARLIAFSPAADLMLRLLQTGLARFEPTTGEFCFDGMRYGANDRDWNGLLAVIGWEKVRAALARAEGREA